MPCWGSSRENGPQDAVGRHGPEQRSDSTLLLLRTAFSAARESTSDSLAPLVAQMSSDIIGAREVSRAPIRRGAGEDRPGCRAAADGLARSNKLKKAPLLRKCVLYLMDLPCGLGAGEWRRFLSSRLSGFPQQAQEGAKWVGLKSRRSGSLIVCGMAVLPGLAGAWTYFIFERPRPVASQKPILLRRSRGSDLQNPVNAEDSPKREIYARCARARDAALRARLRWFNLAGRLPG